MPYRNATQRLGEFLRAKKSKPEVERLRVHHYWIAQVGGINGLHWYLEERDYRQLDHDATDAVYFYLRELSNKICSAMNYREKVIEEARQARQIPPADRRRLIQARAEQEKQRRESMYDHVKAVEPKLPQRMAIAYERYLLDHLKSA